MPEPAATAETPAPTPAPAAPAKPKPAPKAPTAKPAGAPKPATSTAKPAAKPAAATTPKPKATAKPSEKAPVPKVRPVRVKESPKGTVIDVSGLVLGRAASAIAPRLLKGETIVVVNAEKSVVTGSRKNVLAFYTANRARGSVRSGPHYPRYPDRIFRRTVRGMLPHLKTRGKEALDRLHVFIGVPAPVAGLPRQSIEVAHPRPSLQPPLTLEEITRLLGARL